MVTLIATRGEKPWGWSDHQDGVGDLHVPQSARDVRVRLSVQILIGWTDDAGAAGDMAFNRLDPLEVVGDTRIVQLVTASHQDYCVVGLLLLG